MTNPTALTALLYLALCGVPTFAADAPSAKQLVDDVIASVGGEEKLLSRFHFRERVLIVSEPAAQVTPEEKGNRTSTVEIGKNWWLGTTKRDKDKVRVLAWAWSLRILLDPQSQVQSLPAISVSGRPSFGLRVTGSVKEPIDLYFDQESKRLAAIDYTDTRHIFSEWKQTAAGHHYPSHVAGFRFANKAAGTLQEKQWYQTDVLELTPLKELPAELK